MTDQQNDLQSMRVKQNALGESRASQRSSIRKSVQLTLVDESKEDSDEWSDDAPGVGFAKR